MPKKKTKSKSKTEDTKTKPRVQKPRIIYNNDQREFKPVLKDGITSYTVTHKNVVVYSDSNLKEALDKYNEVGIKEIIMPVKIKKPSKKGLSEDKPS